MTTATQHADRVGLIALLDGTLERVASRGAEADTSGDGKPDTTLGALLTALDERAFGLLLLLLAIPCCIPLLWGIPQIVALPMMAVVFQIAQGRERPWLPEGLKARELDVGGMRSILDRVARYVGWAERLARPRAAWLTEGAALRAVGALLLIPVASILSPIPLSNTAPGIGVAICAIGLLERDGLLTVLGLAFGLVWAVALGTMLAIFGFEGVTLMKDWIKGVLASQDLLAAILVIGGAGAALAVAVLALRALRARRRR